TRYGNVMCSRGSVIPLFREQIKQGKPLTITDPNMTRFLMNLDEAVDLVVFAFTNGQAGDLFVQKSPACTIENLAKATQSLFGDTGIKVIGARHGEKLYETLLTEEESVKAIDLGGYYRVPADNRDLNYDKYFVEGSTEKTLLHQYTSHNTERLNIEGTIEKMKTTEYIKEELSHLE
ncbi:MAG: polysaccharide biosynthesis protein, partial [Oscillospiraceae bacterium]